MYLFLLYLAYFENKKKIKIKILAEVAAGRWRTSALQLLSSVLAAGRLASCLPFLLLPFMSSFKND